MTQKTVRVLLVEGSHEDRRWLEEVVSEIGAGRYVRAWMRDIALVALERLSQALAALGAEKFDAVLMNPTLPDSQGLHAFLQLERRAPSTPVVALLNREDEDLALSLVAAGAQDVLVKTELECLPLARALCLAIERKRNECALRTLVFVDSLTGLCNWAGFLNLGEHYLRLSRRLGQACVLTGLLVEGLDEISRRYGRQERDLALMEAAELLRNEAVGADLVARVGEGRFAIAAVGEEVELGRRLEQKLRSFYRRKADRNPLRVRWGQAVALAGDTATIEELWHGANRSLCDNKPCVPKPAWSELELAV